MGITAKLVRGSGNNHKTVSKLHRASLVKPHLAASGWWTLLFSSEHFFIQKISSITIPIDFSLVDVTFNIPLNMDINFQQTNNTMNHKS